MLPPRGNRQHADRIRRPPPLASGALPSFIRRQCGAAEENMPKQPVAVRAE
ncbi:hypothetical protein [Thermostilla marina]